MREGLSALIRRQQDMELCGEAASAAEAVEQITKVHPDLALVDISLGDSFNGIELTKRLTGLEPDLRVLIVSAHDESLYAERALRSGALGFVSKAEPVTEVIHSIRQVAEGKMYVSERIRDSLLRQYLDRGGWEEQSAFAILSDRELETFELIGRGMTTRQIAEAMAVSPKTVETYRANIKQKLVLDNSTELTRHAAMWVADSAERADPI